MKKILLLAGIILCLKLVSFGQAAPYCLPTYSNSPSGDYINTVQLGPVINNTNSGSNGSSPNYYTNNTALGCAQLNPGMTYTMTVQCGTWSLASNNIYAWIDYNHDNTFQNPAEKIGQVTNMVGNQTSTITFTVPVSALSGLTRLRVREIYGTNVTSPDPCTSFGFGEVEDYCVSIISPYAKDIGTVGVVSPTSDCGLSANTPINANFFNSGTDTIYNFTVSYDINNGFSTATEVINDTILPQTIYNYTFTTLADFSTPGPNSVWVWASLSPLDSNSINDSAHVTINNYLLISTFPFVEDFNSGALSIAARTSNGSASQSFVSSIAARSSTNGFLMTGTNGGSFSFPSYGTEWTINQSSRSTLEYCIDATDTANLHCGLLLKFDLKQTATYSDLYSSFRVLVNGNQISPTYHPTLANVGFNSDPWIHYTLNLQSFIGTAFNLTFESRNKYDSLNAPPGDNAYIDNINIGPNPPIDISTLQILNPVSDCYDPITMTNNSVTAIFKNTGCNTLPAGTIIPLKFDMSTYNTVVENYILPASLPFNTSFTYTFNTTRGTPIGIYNLKVYATMPNDGDAYNDADSIVFIIQPRITSYPSLESFDTDSALYWLSKPLIGFNNWEVNLGGITSPWIPSPHSGPGLIKFSDLVPAGNSADLISPCYDFSTLKHPSMKFWLGQYAFSSKSLYIDVSISTNGGSSFILLDTVSVQNNLASPALWNQFQFCLNNYAFQPNVKIKFTGHGDNNDNIAIDDVLIEDIADTNRVSVLKDTICSGATISANVTSTNLNRKYFIADQNNNILSAKISGNNSTLTLTTLAGISNSFTLKIGFTDSLPTSYCEFYMADTIPIKVYQQTAANAGVDTALCFGSSSTLNGTGGMTYQWTPSIGLSNPNIANPGVTITSTTTYTLVTNNPANCPTNDVVIISVTPIPSAFAGVDKVLCSVSNPVLIGGSPAGTNGTIPYTYSWSPNVGFTSSNTIANPNVAPSSTTTYVLTVTDLNLCSAKDSMVLIYNPPISYSLSSSNVSCNGLNNGSASISIFGGTNPTVIWGTSPTTSNNPITNLSPNKYMVYITDAKGCGKVDSVIITQPGKITSSIIGGNTTCGLCNGNAAAIISGGTTPYTYNWSNGFHTDSVKNLCNATYKLNIIDNAGCTKLDSVVITGPNGATSLKIDAGTNVQVCQGYSTYIGGVPTITGGTSPYTYQWSPSTFLSNSTVANPFVTLPTTTTTYYVTAADGFGCIKTDSVTIIVNSLPIANAGSDITYCKTANAQIGGNTINGLTYKWTPSAGLNVANIANPMVNITASETYTVTVTDFNGCFSSDQIVVTVNTEPIVNAGPDKVRLNAAPINLTATGAVNYTWSPPYGLSATFGNAVQASPTATTTYTVTGVDVNGCSSTDDVIIFVLNTGIDEISSKIDLKIYPNPFSNQASVEFNLSENKNIKVLLFSATGQLVQTILDEKDYVGYHKLDIETEQLSAGQYIVLIQTNDGVVAKKIIKQ